MGTLERVVKRFATDDTPEYICQTCEATYDVRHHVCPKCGGYSVERPDW